LIYDNVLLTSSSLFVSHTHLSVYFILVYFAKCCWAYDDRSDSFQEGYNLEDFAQNFGNNKPQI